MYESLSTAGRRVYQPREVLKVGGHGDGANEYAQWERYVFHGSREWGHDSIG